VRSFISTGTAFKRHALSSRLPVRFSARFTSYLFLHDLLELIEAPLYTLDLPCAFRK